MSQSSSFVTLMVLSILSNHSSVDVATRTRRGNGLDGDDSSAESDEHNTSSMLHRASVALAVTFAVALSLSPNQEANDRGNSSTGPQEIPSLEQEGAGKLYAVEACNYAKTSWAKRVRRTPRSSRVKKTMKPSPSLPIFTPAKSPSPESVVSMAKLPLLSKPIKRVNAPTLTNYAYVPAPTKKSAADVPALTACDSLSSFLREFSMSSRSSSDMFHSKPNRMSSMNSITSSDKFQPAPRRMSRRMSAQRNEEWAVIE